MVGDGLEELAEPSAGDPAAEAVVDGVPGAELGGQIAPGAAGAGDVEQGFQEEAVGDLGFGPAALATGGPDVGPDDIPEGVGEHLPHGESCRREWESLQKFYARRAKNVNMA